MESNTSPTTTLTFDLTNVVDLEVLGLVSFGWEELDTMHTHDIAVMVAEADGKEMDAGPEYLEKIEARIKEVTEAIGKQGWV
jgi:hypothetical protein